MHGEPPDPGDGALHPERCPVCSSDLVEPVYWAQLDPDHWRLELRCPECEAQRTSVFDAATVHAYSIVLYEAAARSGGAGARAARRVVGGPRRR